jgi:hypothetical protein
MSEDIWSEDWREPGDDCERLAVYTLTALGGVAGLWMMGSGVWGLMCPAETHAREWFAFNLVAIAVGLAMAVGGYGVLRAESRHWNLRGLTADRMVAGLFLFGFALMVIGVEMEHPVAIAAMLGAGVVVLGIALVVGLLCAFAPRLFVRRYRLPQAYVVERFALDDKLQAIPDAPLPFEPSWTPCVRLRTAEGELTTLRATPTAYEFALPGCLGDAQVRGYRVRQFTPRVYPRR